MTKQPKDMTADELRALIGEPPPGSHEDEWLPRDMTWHDERANWAEEVGRLRVQVRDLQVRLTKIRDAVSAI